MQKYRLKQNTPGIGYGIFSVMVGKTVIPANFRDEQAVGLHGGAGLFRKNAGLRVCTGLANPAAAAAQTQSPGMLLFDSRCQSIKPLQMQLLRFPEYDNTSLAIFPAKFNTKSFSL